jgi:voltage-gated potassium channel
MRTERRQEALIALERLTEIPMLVLSLAMLPLLLAPLVLDVSADIEDTILVADWTIWAVFALELVAKTYLAPQRSQYLRAHWFDVLIVVLPFLRPLRVVRSARALRVFTLARLLSVGARTTHSTRSVLSEHGLQYALGIGGLLVLACAGVVTVLEREGQGNIRDFGDGLWWAITTITTVGYGDRFPVTAEGRGVAAFLMLVGITLFGLVTANIAAFLVKPLETGASLEDVLAQLRRLEDKVEELSRNRE